MNHKLIHNPAINSTAFKAGVGLLSFGISTLAIAQQEATSSEANVEPAAVEQVLVTGSRIRQEAPTGSSVVNIEASEIQAFPASNVVEMLGRFPQVSGAGMNEEVKRAEGVGVRGVNGLRSSDFNLRGLGPGATLVLFNGARTPPTGATGRSMDTSTIPAIALERVEIVADGASAIYGSDAIAGVINFIPYKTYDGAQTRLRYGDAKGNYDTFQVGQLLGQEWTGGGWVLALEHVKSSRLSATERPQFRSDLREFGGRDYRNTQCSPGNILVGSTSYAIPEGGVTPATAGLLTPGTSNRCEVSRLADLRPDHERNAAYFNITHEFTDHIEAYAGLGYSKRETHVRDTVLGSMNLLHTVTVPNTNAFFVAPPGTNPDSVRVEYFFGDDHGLLDFIGHQSWVQWNTGVNFDLPGNWQGNLEYVRGISQYEASTHGVFVPALNEMLASSDPATAYNVFGGGNSESIVSQLFRHRYDPHANYRTNNVTLRADGPVWELPGGMLRAAVGLEYHDLNTYVGNNLGDVWTMQANHRHIITERDTESVFAEALIPIVGAQNAVSGVRALDLSLAIRHDKYSDVGGTTNPKIGLDWSPIDSLLVKASYGTSFKAPFLNDTVVPSIGGAMIWQSNIDPLSPTGRSTGLIWSDSNPTLEPEEAETWSLTLEYRSDALPGLSLSGTFFAIEHTGTIDAPDRVNALSIPQLAAFVTRNPTEAQIEAVRATGVAERGVRPDVVNWLIDGRPQNLGGLKLEGIDFLGRYEWATDVGYFYSQIGGTYMTKFGVQTLPGDPFVDELNTIYAPLELQVRGSLGWTLGPWMAEAHVNHTGSYTNNRVTPHETVDSYTTVDARVSYAFETPLMREVRFGIEALNVLDEDPNFVNIDGGMDLSVASSLGRVISVSATVNW